MSTSSFGGSHKALVVVVAGASVLAACGWALSWIRANRPQLLFRRRYWLDEDVDRESGQGGAPPHPHLAVIDALLRAGPPDLEQLLNSGAPRRLTPAALDPDCVRPTDDAWTWTFVSTRRQLAVMLDDLARFPVLGVDLEAHQAFSFHGMTCLVQIARPGRCYVVDAVALHDDMRLLKPLFEDARRLKLMHGSSNDLPWLQRDFGVYTVNLLDTEQLALALNIEKPGMKTLLKAYCGVESDKALALSDWRERPLPPSCLVYAATDAYYVQHIAARLCAELASQHRPTSGADGTADVPEQPSKSGAAAVPDGESEARGWHAAWVKSQQMSKSVYRFPSRVESTRSAANRVLRKMRLRQPGAHQADADDELDGLAAAASGEGAALSPLTVQTVAVLCLVRDGLARQWDLNPVVLMPDAVVIHLVERFPTTRAEVLSRLRGWALRHAERRATRCSSDGGGPPSKDRASTRLARNPFNHLIERWTPGWVLWWHAGELARALAQAARGTLPADVRTTLAAVLRQDDAIGDAATDVAAKRRAAVARNRERVIRQFSAKGPVYANCRILAKSGEVLSYCDKHKQEWYVKKGLATWVAGDAVPTIQLNFDHCNKLPQQDSAFYSVSKGNRCVGCGAEDHYLRYRVIPACYRKQFPVSLKSHCSHDVVLLCIECHSLAHKAAEQLKRRIAEEHGIPLRPPPEEAGHETASSQLSSAQACPPQAPSADEAAPSQAAADSTTSDTDEADDTPQQHTTVAGVRRAATALNSHGPTMPPDRRRELESIIARYLGRPAGEPALQPGDLEAGLLAGLGTSKRNRLVRRLLEQGRPVPTGITVAPGSEGQVLISAPERRDTDGGNVWHGERVVRRLLEQGGLEALQNLAQDFRRAFVTAINPRFLPPNWSIEHQRLRAFGAGSIYSEQDASSQGHRVWSDAL